jgi:Asp-tRNA(Asn)/Glu-tRNA(Gln) amidotransferase A subunit family amidase
MHDRLREAEAMTLSGYRADTAQREAIRRDYAKLAETASACITLSAPSMAPQGIAATGDPIFAVPSSLLGVPAISMPLATIDGLPLGIQLVGFRDKDAGLFAIARRVAAVMDLA